MVHPPGSTNGLTPKETPYHLEDHLLYVGMSRAVSRLVVVGPSVLMARLQTGHGQNQESGTKLGSLP
jgi:ATP-dependent exoDNAse (exonuclease V) alpha subunit